MNVPPPIEGYVHFFVCTEYNMLFYLFIKLIIRKKSEKLVKILIKILKNYIKKMLSTTI